MEQGNTGVIPPEGEESAEFENVNVNVNENGNGAEPVLESTEESNSNTPLGNIPENAIEVPATALNEEPTMTKAKKPQSAKQQGTMAAQAQERASLKSAGVAKPSVAMVATLASMRSKGDAKYNSAFANAVAGKPLNSYRTAKKPRKATVTNTSVEPARNNSSRTTAKKPRGVNSSTQAASETNMRNRNIVNSRAINGTIDAVLDIAESIGKQMGEMKRLIKTLKAKRPTAPRTSRGKKTNNTSRNNSLLGLSALPVPTGVNTRELSTIPEGNAEENNAFTPPP